MWMNRILTPLPFAVPMLRRDDSLIPNIRNLLWKIPFIALLLAAGCSPKAPTPSEARSYETFTFAVVGDNRGESSGQPSPVFVDIVKALAKDSPDFVINTGDMINGYAGETHQSLRKMWDGYRRSLAPLTMPVHHVPGNHDIYDALSARQWKALWGPTYYSFTHRNALFIALDTETTPGKLGEAQMSWLEQQLRDAKQPNLFIVLHRPLFPVDGHIGTSLDQFPADRDRLHALFLRYRDRIKAVFVGHEHMYHREDRDGLSYFTIAGGGAPLYVPREMGGFYHYLLVHVSGVQVTTEVKRVEDWPEERRKPISVKPGLLEGWDDPHFWYTWDPSVKKEITSETSAGGKHALKIWLNFALFSYPVLSLIQSPPQDYSRVERIWASVFAPDAMNGLQVTPFVVSRNKNYQAPVVTLKPGLNRVGMDLNESWLPGGARRHVEQLQWMFTFPHPSQGWVALSEIHLERTSPSALKAASGNNGAKDAAKGETLLETWKDPLLWGVWNDSVTAEPSPDRKSQGKGGLKVQFDLAKSPRHSLYTPVHPAWDLTRIKSLKVDLFAPPTVAGKLGVRLILASEKEEVSSSIIRLHSGWNVATVNLDETRWPEALRSNVNQAEWILTSSDPKLGGWVVFDNFRVE
jgi:hypothetical protein